ncbi:Na+/phosphate symporter [Congregibacter litoralis KT71]|uniref:Na+/phosphate symporter n=1 Tax=Congregibacter litoralis KT71 TaxID=314285 RepID=A4A5U2_9GAMM|nr:Na+/phosphate symporter [Congregibacter litoralis KT71]
MSSTPPQVGDGSTAGQESHSPLVWLGVVGLVYLLLIGVGTIGDGFKWISGGADGAQAIFAFAGNPIVGVILGVLATALVQSSSTVTSVIVGLVAGGVPVSIAVPMIMGANMGTTITNTIVSLGNFRDRGAFRKSFAAATVHDFFNLFSILIFLPVEVMFHPLERMAASLAGIFHGGAGASVGGFNAVAAMTKPFSHAIVSSLDALPTTMGALITITLGIAMVMISVLYLGKLLRAVMTGKARVLIDAAIGRGALSGIASGTVVTILVQSSSTTTSLVVPLAGAGVLTTRQIYPFTLGANIGTCITALLAATSITGPYEYFALQIALVHLLYNLLGVALFMAVPFLRDLPVRSSEWLGAKVEHNRSWAFGYIGSVFFVVPSVVFGGEMYFSPESEQPIDAACDETSVICAREEVQRVDLRLE